MLNIKKGFLDSRLNELWCVWLIWTLAGLFFSFQLYFDAVNRPFLKALVWQMTAAYIFALGTSPTLWLSRRFPFEKNNWRRNLLIHIFASLLFSLVAGTLHFLNDVIHVGQYHQTSLLNLTRFAITRLLDKELLVYWTIILINHGFSYYNRYQSEQIKAVQLESRLVQAQLHALKMQLNPHFLFNTLNAIAELVYSAPQVADKTITELSDLLRMTLAMGNVQEISLKEEIAFLQKYLNIQQMLLDARLKIQIDIAPETYDVLVPNMLLQPLVENSIRHGIAPKGKGGAIFLSAKRVDDTLEIRLEDNGLGFEPGWQAKGGVGLANMRGRLKHLYGSNHSFDLETSKTTSTKILIVIPFREQESKFENENSHFDSRRYEAGPRTLTAVPEFRQ
jgi:sensor histidine kinase YesM